MNRMALKQLVLGSALVGGGAILICLVNHNEDTTEKSAQKTVVSADVARPVVQPLSPEAQTEQKLNETQKKERENRAIAQEQQIKQLQDNTATTVSTEPVYQTVGETEPQDNLQVRTRPETIVANRVAQQRNEQKVRTSRTANYTIEDGDTLSKIARQHGVSISALAEANGIHVDSILNIGQGLVIPNKGTTAKSKTNNRQSQADTTARQPAEPIKTNGKPKAVKAHYSVQVSMADSQEKADALARKYRQAGYQVQTSRTSRGVRVLVGAENSEAGAKALKSKLDKDGRVDSSGAWVKRVDTINN